MRFTPRSELDRRIGRLQKVLAVHDVECALIRQNVNLFYFGGTIQNSHLFVPVTGRPVLMTRRDFTRARLESALDDVIPLRSLKQIPSLLAEHGIPFPKTLGMELDLLPANMYLSYAELFAGTRLVDGAPLLRQVRFVKTAWEVARLEEAAEQVDLMYRTAREVLREGMSEIELQVELEKVARLNGHPGFLRMRSWNAENTFGVMAAGPNGAVGGPFDIAGGGVGLSPAYGFGASRRKIGRGEPVYMDLSGSVDGYIADQTRVLVVGPPPPRVREAYDSMRGIYARLREAVVPGAVCGELYDLAMRLAGEAGFGEHFMRLSKGDLGFVGHGVGLELDEPPPLARGVETVVEEGMVIALEPKVFLPGVGAIGFENMHVVTADGARALNMSDEDLAVV